VPDYKLYRAKVTCLTPVHIGSGRTLLHRYDYAIRDHRTWRLNEDAILETQDIDDPEMVERLSSIPPEQLLQAGDYKLDSTFFRYVIRGTPRSNAEGAQIIEQLKDAYDRPYLPGTSLKGALRTAIAWVAWEERGLRPDKGKLNRHPQFAAQTYERELLGRNPNHDLLRALHVTDSDAVGVDALMVANARVLHQSGHVASPIEMEAIKPDTVFELTLKIDVALFSRWAGGDALRNAHLLQTLPDCVRRHTAQRIETELAWFKAGKGARKIYDFYGALPTEGLPPHMCLLQLGWGTGWDDKTFGSRLREDDRFMESILADRRQGGFGLARGHRERGDRFPKSRRVAVRVLRSKRDGSIIEHPESPFGWVLMELAEV